MKMGMVCICLLGLSCLGQSIQGVVDIHVHTGPDSVPRSIDSIEAARLYASRGARAILLKNHYEPTAALALLAKKAAPGLHVFGGIALNRTVGGINPAAVERMSRVEGGLGKVVWMPTFDAENQVGFSKDKRPYVRISTAGRLLPEVLEVLDLIAAKKLVLATGHSTPEEVLLLVSEARKRGAGGIVVTHGILAPVLMSMAQMKEAARMGAYVEFVGNAMVGQTRSVEFRDYAKAMRELGVDYCILSSDLGQAGNPLHPDGLEQIFAGLRAAGLSIREIEIMAKRNPARLLGLE